MYFSTQKALLLVSLILLEVSTMPCIVEALEQCRDREGTFFETNAAAKSVLSSTTTTNNDQTVEGQMKKEKKPKKKDKNPAIWEKIGNSSNDGGGGIDIC